MASLLHIALQEGFEADAVVIHLDGEEIYRGEAVTTRTQIGLADRFERTVEEGEMKVEVSLPKRSLDRATTITVAGPTYVGVSVEHGALVLRTRREPFGYV